MAIYVDELVDYSTHIGRCGPFWCHMTADSPGELHAFATRLGLRREWAQHVGRSTIHYDLTKTRRAAAVANGAIEITRRETIIKARERQGATT